MNSLFLHTDLDEGRLNVAKQLGADYIIKVDSSDAKAIAKKVEDCLGAADKTIECTGAESSIHTGIYVSCHSNCHFHLESLQLCS